MFAHFESVTRLVLISAIAKLSSQFTSFFLDLIVPDQDGFGRGGLLT